MRKFVVLTLFFLDFSASLLSQPIFYTPFERGVRDAFQLKFDAVDADLIAMRDNGEQAWRIEYVEFMVQFLGHFVNENQEAYDEDRDILKARIDRFRDEAPKGTPEYYLYLGEMSLGMAGLEAKFKHNWGAAGHGIDGLSAFQKGQELFPSYKPMAAGMGILNVAVGSVPEDYQFITNMMGYRGDIQRGMQYLRSAIESSKDRQYAHLRDKHAFLYGIIAEQLFPDEVSSVSELNSSPDNSPLLAFIESNLLKSKGENDEMIALLEKVTAQTEFYPFPYLWYQLGRAKLARGDEDANRVLERFISINKGGNYVKSTNRYLHWYYRLRGDAAKANQYKNLVISQGETAVGADLQALREIERGEVPINLLKARLEFDHGRPLEALALLRSVDVESLSPQHLIDYHYRVGRANQELGRNSSAIRSFQSARSIDRGDETTFEQVNATLQLAILTEDNDRMLSTQMYRAVLDYDDYPWRHTTQQKAKAGLSRLDAV